MARIRTIKPDFFHNEDVAEMSFEARLLFIGLWTIADGRGRLEDRPKRIKALLFPYDNIEVNQHLDELRSAGFIARYETVSDEGACNVIQIKNFNVHQRISGKEAELESEFAPPPSRSNREATGKQRGSNGEAMGKQEGSSDRFTIVQEGKGREGERKGKGKEGEGAELFGADASAPPATTVITIPLNDNSEFPLFDHHLAEWTKLYPAIDVLQSLRDARGWCIANPSKRKTKSGVMRFVNRWLSEDQNNPRKHRGADAINPPGSSRGNTTNGRHIPLSEVAERERRFRERHGITAVDEAGAGPMVLEAQSEPRLGPGHHANG